MSNNLGSLANLPDFWSRQSNRQSHVFKLMLYGLKGQITANQADVLEAAQLSAGRFSQTGATSDALLRVQIVVRADQTGPLPLDLSEQLIYTGLDDWIAISAGPWGHGFASVSHREAVIVLSPELAADTRLVSRYFIDHYLLNFVLTRWAMLHASCVLSPDKERLIVMIAPHNTGKSTTALHLLRAGFYFLADGMVLFRPSANGFEVGGYPIGEVKLRDDVLAQFPEYTGQAVQVREHRKTVVNLRQLHPALVQETTLFPTKIQLCFVERDQQTQTIVQTLSGDEALTKMAANTIFWNEPEKLQHNTVTLEQLIRIASIYQIKLGTNPDNIITTLNSLGSRT